MAYKKRPARERRERHDGWTAVRRELFLDELARSCNVTAACAAAGKGKTSAYDLRRRDPEFDAQWAAALDSVMDELLAIAMDRVKNGVEREIVGKDGTKTRVLEFSDRLIMFLLARYRPELHKRVVETRRAEAEKAAANSAIYDNVARKMGWPARTAPA